MLWREMNTVICEACQSVIPEEHWYPKPRCMRCGWKLSCCNPEVMYSPCPWEKKEDSPVAQSG